MSLGEKLLELRKKEGLSQEMAAEKLNVSRQTISKWETDQSTPDFDKIVPICNLYEIRPDELVGMPKEELGEDEITENNINENYESKVLKQSNRKKLAISIGIGVLMFIIAVASLILSVELLDKNFGVPLFLVLVGIGVFVIVFGSIAYGVPENKKELTETEKKIKSIQEVIALIVLVIYLSISFYTLAWHVTWILWVVFALIAKVVEIIVKYKEGEK